MSAPVRRRPAPAVPAARARVEPARTRPGALDALLGFRLRLAQIAVFRDLHVALGPLDITPAAYGVLELAHANPGLTQARLAAAIRLDGSTLVPLLDRLSERGLVRRESATDDRRRNRVFVSASGERLRRAALAAIRSHERRTFGRLTASERERLRETLARLAGDDRA
ncbi:MAG: MarR family transcriptional regulator [Burkholderiales bacterium]|nr:MarR family transcriptional regulator [Burkholderiales bacterium]